VSLGDIPLLISALGVPVVVILAILDWYVSEKYSAEIPLILKDNS
jgi:hypothetical protein